MAAGAILPPLFFERRLANLTLRGWQFQEHPETHQSHERNLLTGSIGRHLAVGHCRRKF
jgi:hypothetical protein